MDIENTSLDCSVHTPEGVFYFRVSQDPAGRTSVSDLRRGSTYWTAAYPYEVHQAITEAINRLENLMANTSKINGVVSLDDQSTGAVLFNKVLANTSYQVVFSIDDFIPIIVTDKTTTGFTFELATSYTGLVRYDVIY
jgi:glutaredoxin 2